MIRMLPLLLPMTLLPGMASAEDVIVYTCHQTWDSRIYIMTMDGQVLDWFQYDYFRLCDLDVVDGMVSVADAFAPRSYTVDLLTGDLDLVIDDWSLYYFYDLAWDGGYLYVTEWDLNRYLPDGTRDSSTGFDYDTMGACFDGEHYWTVSDDGVIRCWDISAWPLIEQIESLCFQPPSDSCRGLWFDGECFWTAEALESSTGFIYRFTGGGVIVQQWAEPAFTGWSACVATGYPSGLEPRTWAAIKSGF